MTTKNPSASRAEAGRGRSTRKPAPLALPAWASRLKQRYLSGEATLFLLHGNVLDLVQAPDDADTFVNLREFLRRFLMRTREMVGFFNPSEGLLFAEPEMAHHFREVVNAQRRLHHQAAFSHHGNRNVGDVLEAIEQYMRRPETRGAIILDFVETLVPEGTIAFMGPDDRGVLVTLQRWANDPRMLSSDNLVILVTENQSDVHRRVVTNPQLASIEIPLPDEEERTHFLRVLKARYPQADADIESLAPMTAGLSRIQIEGIFRHAEQADIPVDSDLVARRKQEIIEQECYGLVEFVSSTHGFDHVGGLDPIKKALSRAVSALKEGRTRQVPMGMLFVGPMGTGKTYLAEAFAHESGLTALKFKNFRDRWVGSTEANLEKILHVIDAMGFVLVIIDEGDRSLGGGSGDNDGGTSSRVIARLKEFMSDTTHRGRIIFVMMTNRPDKLDADMKRSGRFDLKIPFFFPATIEERVMIFDALLKKNGIRHHIEDLTPAAQRTVGYSGAEIEAIVLLAVGFAHDAGRDALTEADIAAAVEDFIPSRDMAMIDYMELLAVFECSSRSMLPEKYRQLTTEELNQRLREMRRGLL